MNISKILLEYQPAQPSPSPRQVPCLTCFQEQVCWEPDYFTLRYTRCPIEYLHNHESCYQERAPGAYVSNPRPSHHSWILLSRQGCQTGRAKRSHTVVCILIGLLKRVRSRVVEAPKKNLLKRRLVQAPKHSKCCIKKS